jgi:hypothetical protein
MVTPEPGHGRLRASHADREHVVDVLKGAFVHGRLTQDELDTRAGQALAARTYADLAALTADLPAGLPAGLPVGLTAGLPAEPERAPAPVPAPPPAPAPAQNSMASTAVKSGAGAIGAVILLVSGTALVLGQPAAAGLLAIFIAVLAAVATGFVSALIAVSVKVESRHRNRSRGQLPPGPASGAGGPASPSPAASDRARPPRRHPPGALAAGRAS